MTAAVLAERLTKDEFSQEEITACQRQSDRCTNWSKMLEFLNIFGHQAYEEDLQVMSSKFDSMQEQWSEIESIAKWL